MEYRGGHTTSIQLLSRCGDYHKEVKEGMSTIDVSQTILSAAHINIALVPVGQFPKTKFIYYSNVIRQFSYSMDISQFPNSTNRASVMPKQNPNSRIFLNFIDFNRVQRWDNWEDFQNHRKIMGVIGLLYCPRFSDLSQTTAEFKHAQANYPTSLVSMGLAFEPRDDQPDWDFSADNSLRIIMVPNTSNTTQLNFYLETLLIDFVSRVVDKIENLFSSLDTSQSPYFSTPLDPVSTGEDVLRVKKRKFGRLNKIKGDYCLLVGSPGDAISFYDVAIEQARMSTDFVWWAGSCEGKATALLLLNSKNSTSIQDSEGSEPGEIMTKKKVNEEVFVDMKEIYDLYEEAINYYNKSKAKSLELESCMKLARYYCQKVQKNNSQFAAASASIIKKNRSMNTSGGGSNSNHDHDNNPFRNAMAGGQSKIKMAIMDLVMKIFYLSSDPHSLLMISQQEKILISNSIAKICYDIGFFRKYSFFMRESAILYQKLYQNQIAHKILLFISNFYYIDSQQLTLQSKIQTTEETLDDSDKATSVDDENSSTHGTSSSLSLSQNDVNHNDQLGRINTNKGWQQLQKSILKELITVSTSLNDISSIVHYTLYNLRHLRPILSDNEQKILANELSTLSQEFTSASMENLNLTEIPVISMMSPISLSPMRQPIFPINTEKDKDNPFIVVPAWFKNRGLNHHGHDGDSKSGFSGHSGNEITWVMGEIGTVAIELVNLFSFGIYIESISLLTVGAPFESFPVELVLKPHGPTELILSGRPMAVGELEITGCVIRTFNISSKHYFNYYKNFSRSHSSLVKLRANENSLKIRIVPSLPLLELTDQFFGTQLDIIEGQNASISLVVNNLGSSQADWVNISVTSKNFFDKIGNLITAREIPRNDASIGLSWNEQELKQNLPCPPGSQFNLKIKISSFSPASNATIVMEYGTGAPGTGMRRRTMFPIKIDVLKGMEGLEISGVEVLEYDEEYCEVVLEVKNLSGRRFELETVMFETPERMTVIDEKRIVAEENSVNRIALKSKRFEFEIPETNASNKNNNNNRNNRNYKGASSSNVFERKWTVELLKRMKLRWTSFSHSSSSKQFGALLLRKGTYLTKGMIKRIQPEKLKIEVEVEKNEGEEMRRVNVKVKNKGKKEMSGLTLHLRPHDQKGMIKTRWVDLREKLAWCGSLDMEMGMLKGNGEEEFNHSVLLYFFAAGLYFFEVDCLNAEREVVKRVSFSILVENAK